MRVGESLGESQPGTYRQQLVWLWLSTSCLSHKVNHKSLCEMSGMSDLYAKI
jgi:hypothetical protein